ncbi:unnamed protein product [Paramecium octaurelia]|uniref:Uncharacterized protein n=1 Tax=Paramecium octaurelia TaxID=43137 RepID=A0A8S1WCR3_PAROT|nr:unnamed protein product [Paramecium octaurelia]
MFSLIQQNIQKRIFSFILYRIFFQKHQRTILNFQPYNILQQFFISIQSEVDVTPFTQTNYKILKEQLNQFCNEVALLQEIVDSKVKNQKSNNRG